MAASSTVSSVFLLFLHLHACCGLTRSITIASSDIFIEADAVSSWRQARNECRNDHNADLYRPLSGYVPFMVTDSLLYNTFYWVGAIQTSNWTWSLDGAPLYTYEGITGRPGRDVVSTQLQGKSVYKCHTFCGIDCTVFGIQKRKCYCFGNKLPPLVPNSAMRGSRRRKRMRRNRGQITVYRSDISFKPKENGQCFYMMKIKTTGQYRVVYFQVNDTECTEKKQIACYSNLTEWQYGKCSDNVCVTWPNLRTSWSEAAQFCHLLKMTSSNQEAALSLMSPDTPYWIGLSRNFTSRWIDGTETDDYSSTLPQTLDPKCLGLYREFSASFVTLEWTLCNTSTRYICEIKRSPPDTTTENATPIVSSTTLSVSVGVSTPSSQSSERRSDAYIWIAVVVVVLILILILVIILLKRYEKLCFRQKPGNDGMDIAMENATYGIHMQIDDENKNVTVKQTLEHGLINSGVVAMPSVGIVPNEHNYSNVEDVTEGEYNVLFADTADRKQSAHVYNFLPNHDKGLKYTGDYDSVIEEPSQGASCGVSIATAGDDAYDVVQRNTCVETCTTAISADKPSSAETYQVPSSRRVSDGAYDTVKMNTCVDTTAASSDQSSPAPTDHTYQVPRSTRL